MNRRILGTCTLIALTLGALPAGGHTSPSPSRVTALSAVSNSSTVDVAGTASFGGQAVRSMGTDAAGDMPVPVLPGAYDIVEAKLGQLNPANGDLTFVFKLADLPAGVSPPEAARYIWDFGIDMGGETPVSLQIEGKFTDVARRQSARIPSFVLRGNCVQDGSIITCTDVANLTAEYIGSDDEIWVDVPKTVLEQQANGSIDGRSLVPVDIFEGIGVHPAAYFSLGGTGDTLAWDPETHPFSIGYNRVRIGIAPTGQQPSQMVDAVVSGGQFTGSLSKAGLAPGTYDVVAQACYGVNCGTRITQVTI